MENILITGSKGQLGSEFLELSQLKSNYKYYFTDVDKLDICNYNAVNEFVKSNKISIIVNCAAYTAVDKAESEPGLAMQINGEGVGVLAKVCTENDAFLIHISTDYLFSGETYSKPISETDIPVPVGVYALSKYFGELKMQESLCNGAIIRTSWLFSPFGQNFVKTMLRLSNERDLLKVVCDQIGTPTYSLDLVQIILKILEKSELRKSGIHTFHFSNEGVCSWYDFTFEILRQTKSGCKVLPITTEEYPLPAPRPAYSVFSKSKIKKELSIEIPHWTESLTHCLTRLNQLK